MEKQFEVIGIINKEELVSVLDHNIINNTFVLEINHPYPGYHGHPVKDAQTPRSVIFITKKKHPWDQILRTAKEVNKCLKNKIECSYINVSLHNKLYHGIRVKGFRSYKQVKTVQNAFHQEGYEWQKAKKLKLKDPALISLKKFFYLSELGENMFMENNKEHVSYFLIGHHLNWELFRKVTMDIKNNIDNNNFDAAAGVFYRHGDLQEMIRIFKPDITTEFLTEIKKMYEREIKKYF